MTGAQQAGEGVAGLDGEGVVGAGAVVARAAHDEAGLIDGGLHLLGAVGALVIDDDALGGAVGLLVAGERDGDPVVLAAAEGFALALGRSPMMV